MNNFDAYYTDEHRLMAEIRSSSLRDFFADVFSAAAEQTEHDSTGFHQLIVEWLNEFDLASVNVAVRE